MFVGIIKIKLYAEWVHSLKEKRMIVQSLIAKTRNKFNVSVHQVDAWDIHQTIVLGISMTSHSESELTASLEKIVRFIENNTDAAVLNIEKEIL